MLWLLRWLKGGAKLEVAETRGGALYVLVNFIGGVLVAGAVVLLLRWLAGYWPSGIAVVRSLVVALVACASAFPLLPRSSEHDPIERRPFCVTAIGWFLILWNLFLVIAYLRQELYGGMPISGAILFGGFSVCPVYVAFGIGILFRKNWARVGYLCVALVNLVINIVADTSQFGIDGMLELIPSLLVTVIFVSALGHPAIKTWFRGGPSGLIFRKSAWLTPASVLGGVIAGLVALFLLTNHYFRVAGPGDLRSRGCLEYYLNLPQP